MKTTALIGLGNLLMSDEGIGVRVVQTLIDVGSVPDDVEAMDLGPGGLTVLHAMTGFERVVFVDCAFMDLVPGSWQRFAPEQARTVKVRGRQSLHEGDLFETLALADRLGRAPKEIVIFGVQPQLVDPGEELSPVLRSRMTEYMDAVITELKSPPSVESEGDADA